MATVNEQSVFTGTIYEIERTDPVEGGPSGAFNRGIQDLANRSRWAYDKLIAAGLAGSAREYSGDLNALRETGSFLVRSGATNRPVDRWGHLYVIAADQPAGDAVVLFPSAVQLYFSQDGHFIRRYTGTWTAWDQVVTEASLSANNYAPTGAVQYYAGVDTPTGWFKCQGQNLSVAAYPELYAVFGSPGSPGATTFTLPDCRGEFLRGLDESRGVDSGRAIRTAQTEDLASHVHAYSHYIPDESTANVADDPSGTVAVPNLLFTENTDSAGGTETRPRNVAFNVIIRY